MGPLHKSASHELTTVVILLHPVDPPRHSTSTLLLAMNRPRTSKASSPSRSCPHPDPGTGSKSPSTSSKCLLSFFSTSAMSTAASVSSSLLFSHVLKSSQFPQRALFFFGLCLSSSFSRLLRSESSACSPLCASSLLLLPDLAGAIVPFRLFSFTRLLCYFHLLNSFSIRLAVTLSKDQGHELTTLRW